MPVLKFKFSCVDEKACEYVRENMSDFKNKKIKEVRDHDHTATKIFPSWGEGITAAEQLKNTFAFQIVDLTIQEI